VQRRGPVWPVRLHEAADEITWAAGLNLLWLAGTLTGGVLLGVGPATLAAGTLARRHAGGEKFRATSAFAAAYRREFVRGSVLVLPLLGAAALLTVNYRYFASVTAVLPRLVTLAALAVLVVVASFLLPMAVHYDLRASVLLPKASLFALTRPAPSVLLLLVAACTAYASRVFPFLVVVISVGGWIQLDTWLCLRFFAENEARLRGEPR